MRHWNNTGKRGLALFLALLMCLNLLSLSALAANVDPEIPPTAEEGPLETTDGSKSEDPDDPEQGEEENNLEGSEDPAPPADNEEPSSDTPDDGPEDKVQNPAQDKPEELVEENPAQDDLKEPEAKAPNKVPAKQKASKTASGWYQDEQTVKGDSSDAVCEDTSNGGIHLKAQTGSGNGRGTDTSGWPTVFVNEAVNEALYGAGVDVNATKFVELTFTPVHDQSKPFGVFLNYSEPGNGFLVGYDWNGGWCWQPCDSNTYPSEPWYTGTRVPGPSAGVETTLRVEWQGTTLTKATVAGNDLFGGTAVDFSVNTGEGFGIKCAGDTEVTISHFDCGVVAEEPPVETTISGTVTAGGNPVVGAVVTLEDTTYMPVAGQTATTDANGAFSFAGVTATGCKVKVQAEGYQVTTVDASAETSVALTAETTGTKVYTNSTGDLTQMGGLTETNVPTFETVDGAVKVTFNGDRTQNNAVVKEFDFVNGEISFDVTPTGNTSRFGITLRGTAGNNRIFVGQNNTISTWFWNTWADGNEKYNMGQDQVGVPLSVKSGVTRNVRVKIVDSTVSAYLDGIEAYTITLPDGIPTGAGFAGIVANSAAPVVIDNIRIVSFDSDEPTPPATYTLSGKVTGENSAAVSGATVTAGEKSTTTDANGAYSIAGLVSGNYTVSVSAEGYISQSAQVAVSGNTTKNWTLAQPDPTATYTVKGSVYTMPGNWALWYWTMQVKQGGEVLQTIESSKKNAAFTITGLAAGTYTLEVSSKGYQTAQIEITVTDQDLDKVFIQLYKPEKLECGVEPNTVFYELNGTELRIYGEGAMIDWAKVSSSYSGDDLSTVVPWGTVKLTKVTIEEGVTNVGSKSFSGQGSLTEVSLPNSLAKIGSEAFKECYYLQNVTIPASVTEIGSSAFYKCSRLNNVTLPAGLTEIANNAFYGCDAFTEITIPEGVTKIGEAAFSGCDELATVNWGSVKEIGKSAFAGTGLTKVVLPETVTILNDQAFYGSDLISIVIPDDVALRNTVFQNCYALQNVVLLGEPHLQSTDKTHYGESSSTVFREVYNSNSLFIYASGDAWMAKLAEMSSLGVNTYYIANLDGGVLDGTFETGKLATPTKEGYTFQGWQDAEGNGLTDDTATGTVFTAQWAEEAPKPTYTAQGECGKVEGKVFYGLTADGVLHIWGEGEMKDYAQLPGSAGLKDPAQDKRAPWIAYNLAYTSVEIEEGVTSIGNYAFIPNTYAKPAQANLQSVTLPDTLAKIGQYAFFQSNLAGSIKIPDSVTTMGQNAFSQTQITSAILSQGMTTVPRGTFSGCTNLSDVTIPNGVKTIVDYAFSECSSLTSITFPDTLTTINSSAFEETGLTSVTLPDSVKTLNNTAFWKNPNLESVDLGSVQIIGNQVFQDCPKLTAVELPETLKSLGTAFRSTGIASITVPDGVELKSQAFDQMSALRNIVLQGTPKLAGSNGGSFGWMSSMGENLIIYVESGSLAETVGTEAEIGLKFGYKPDVSDIFYYIANLDSGTLTKEVAPGKLAPAEKEGFVFQGWKAADGTALTAGEDGYYAIPAGTARGTVYTAQWTEKVEYVAEGNCGLWPHVEDVHYQLTADGALRIWGKGKMNNWTHASDVPWDKLNVTSVVVEKGVTSIGQNAFNAYKSFVESPIKLTSVTLPETLETIGPAAFKFCAELEQVSIPEGVTEIGAEAFSGCKKLNNVTLPQGLTEIANNAFSNCQAFTSVTLPENVTKIGSGAFSGCKDLKDLELNGVTEIGNSAFYGCASITGMTLPEGLTQLNDQTFRKSGVTSVTIPAGVKFSNYPFKEATALQNVVFLGAPSSEGSGSFYGTKHTGTLIVYLCNSDANGLKAVQSLVGSNPSICIADANGGALAGAVIPGKLAPVSKADDIFLGWQTADGTMLNKDENGYYAIPENAETGTVYTALFGGFHTVTINGTEYTVKYGDKLSTVLPAKNPTRVGYTFQGWVDAEGNDVTADTVVTGDMTVTANWQVSTYTVTYVIDGETVKTAEYTYGSAVEPFSAPEKEGYTFIGWTGEPKTMPAEDVTVTGSYAVNTYTITVDGTEHTVEHGDKLSTVLPAENPTRVGYTFQGWVDAEGNEVTGDTPITGAMTVTPKWELNSYTVTVGEQKITVKHGESLGGNMPADPSRSGYEFSGWFTSESGGERITAETPITSDVTLHARWTYVGGGGTWTPSVPAPTPTPPLVEVEDPDVPLAELPLPFEDVADGDWYREAVAFMYKNDLMLGVSDKLFGVSTNTTRGMMATVIYRLEKEPGVAFEKVFNDVDNGKWFSQAITWANANGVAVGYDDNSFGPEDNVTREQLVTMLYRYAAKKGYDVSKQADLSAFVDAGRVSGYAREAMGWAVANGIIQGRGANTLAPTDLALRVEVATIFQRFAARYMTIETTA